MNKYPLSSIFGYKYPVTSRFGPRNGRMHKGVDIGTPTGTPIYSPCDGTITRVGTIADDRRSGNFVYVTSSVTQRVYKFRHCQKVRVKVGAVVKSGAVIATTGATGFTTVKGVEQPVKPHCHMEVFENDVAVDPLIYIDETL